MPKDIRIICDKCGKDLTTTGNSIDYRLALINQSIPSWGGIVTDMMVYPPIETDAYFCGFRCLQEWVMSKRKLEELIP